MQVYTQITTELAILHLSQDAFSFSVSLGGAADAETTKGSLDLHPFSIPLKQSY